MLADLLRTITSAWFALLFHSYLSTTTFSGKFLTLPQLMQISILSINKAETALSEILESISVQ